MKDSTLTKAELKAAVALLEVELEVRTKELEKAQERLKRLQAKRNSTKGTKQ